MNAVKTLLPLAIGLSVLLAGCGASSPAPVAIVAIDASGSAREFFPAFERAARDVNESIPPGGTLEIYRFDRTVNEIHVGQPLDASQFKRTLKTALAPERHEQGTSLLALAQKLDGRMKAAGAHPVDLTILTDCGVETMTKADHAKVRELVGGWPGVRKIEFVGLRPLHHEAIRADFAPLESKLTIR